MGRHQQPHPAHAGAETDDLNTVGGHCPRCLVEYRPGFHLCADCDVPLIPGPAPTEGAEADHRDAWARATEREWSDGGQRLPPDDAGDRGMAEIATLCSLGWEEAWLLAGRLRAEGVPALVSPDDYAAYSRFHLRTFDVVVRADQLAEARRIAAAFTGA